MSTAAMRTRLAKLEKRQKRLAGREMTEITLARWIGYCLTCAANGYGTEAQRDHGRRIAITLARSRTRAGEDFSPGLSNLLLRALVGEAGAGGRSKRNKRGVSATSDTPAKSSPRLPNGIAFRYYLALSTALVAGLSD